MEVNWLNTMALAEGSACSILCTSSLRASILVLLWKSVVLMRLRMLLFLLLRALAGDCSHRIYRLLLRQLLSNVNRNIKRRLTLHTECCSQERLPGINSGKNRKYILRTECCPEQLLPCHL